MRARFRAPAVVAGAFALHLVCAARAGDPLALARQLFEDGCWAECRRECDRVLAATPDDAAAAELGAAARKRMDAGEAPSFFAAAASWPGRAAVALYRRAIRPAIGSRCELDPSCSEYFLQASRKHGLLGFPIAADRIVREPSVVRAHSVSAPPGGPLRIPDPLRDHDFWIGRARARAGPRRRRRKNAPRGRARLRKAATPRREAGSWKSQ